MVGKPVGKEVSANTASTRRGAINQSVTFREKSDSYFQHHRSVAKDSVQRLWFHPIASLMTLAVIAIALALPSGFYLLLKNAQVVTQNWDGRAQISLFLSDKVSEEQGVELGKALKKNNDVEKTEFISKAQALKEFEDVSGLKNVMGGLSENPLPSVIVVYPKSTEPEFLGNLQSQLANEPGVDLAQLDSQWVQRLYSILKLGQRIVGALAIGLVLAVLLVVVNTIGLAIENRKDEIIITKLVGATDSFVRRPFLYTGVWYGLGGGVLALMTINAFLVWLNSPVNELAVLYGAHFSLSGLGFLNSFGLLFGASFLGLLGAWMAVGRHLREIEPH